MEISYYTSQGKEIKISQWLFIVAIVWILSMMAGCFTAMVLAVIFNLTT